jgi:hypothetical protein
VSFHPSCQKSHSCHQWVSAESAIVLLAPGDFLRTHKFDQRLFVCFRADVEAGSGFDPGVLKQLTQKAESRTHMMLKKSK